MTNFIKNIQAIHGNAGLQWIKKLPTIIALLQTKWHLEQINPVENLSYNYVVSAYQTTTQRFVICKISYQLKDILQEYHTLNFYNGTGSCNVYKLDTEHNAMLLEYLEPATALSSLCFEQDDTATIHATNLIKKLHHQETLKNHNFPHIKDWLQLLYTLKTTAIPEHHLKKAQQLSEKLLAQPKQEVLLHGDLHHDNIILGNNGWTAIDPKGIIGESAWEIEPLIKNPKMLLHRNDKEQLIKRRLEICATELDIEKLKLIKHCYVRSVLASCWTIKNKPNEQYDTDWLMLEATIFEAILE